jgi:tetratricopeptide (TPR) repeat protein
MGEVWAAHDPELDREVAIKLLGLNARGLDAEGHARLRREAQAMARLTHPNIVRIYELGSDGDLIFCAMELVDGETLRQWLKTPRSWRQTLDVLLAAGRGVAAAHAAGLVHRDVKPDNVMIARDGRILVTDFGLAKLAGRSAEPMPDTGAGATGSSADLALTRSGVLVGTPIYMPPELLDGRNGDALSDQFSFCVMAYEALYGARPFPGSTLADLMVSILDGPAPPPQGRSAPPRGLWRCVLRGLAFDKEKRWPDMVALLAGLERVATAPRRRRIAMAIAGAVTAALTAAVVVQGMSGRDDEALVREAGASRMARAWSPPRQQGLRAAFRSGDPAVAELAGATASALDSYRDAWLAMRVDAWGATHRRKEQSARLLEQRMLCLDRLADELDAFTQIASATQKPEDLRRVAQGARRMTPVSTCANAERIGKMFPGAFDPTNRTKAHEQVEVVEARLRATLAAKRPGEGLEEIADAVAEARGRGVPGLATGLLYLQASSQDEAGHYADVEATLRQLIQEAAHARRHEMVATAWIRLVETLAAKTERPQEARALEPAARAAVAQAGDDPFQRGDLAIALGALEYALGNKELSRDRFQEAYDAFLAARGPQSWEVANAGLVLGQILNELGQRDKATTYAQHAYETFRAGGRTFDALTIKSLNVLAQFARERNDLEAAVRYGTEAVSDKFRTAGTGNVETASARCQLGQALSDLKRHEEAIAQVLICDRDLRRAYGAKSLEVVLNGLGVATILEEGGRIAEAEKMDREAVQILRAAAPPDPANLSLALVELARVVAHRSPAEAVPLYDEGMRMSTALPDRKKDEDVTLLKEIARTGLAARRARWALAWFDRLPHAAAKLPKLKRRLVKARRRG